MEPPTLFLSLSVSLFLNIMKYALTSGSILTARCIALVVSYTLGQVQIFQTLLELEETKPKREKRQKGQKVQVNRQKHHKRRHGWIIEYKRAKRSQRQKAKNQMDKKNGRLKDKRTFFGAIFTLPSHNDFFVNWSSLTPTR